MNKDEDMAYAAGILDGDGSFSIMKSGNKYYPCIQLSNAFQGMAEWLYENFGGSLRIKRPQKSHYKVLYVWSVRGLEGCKNLIGFVSPYLVLKGKQALCMLEFIEKRSRVEFDERSGEKFSLKMRELNRSVLMNNEGLCDQTNETTQDPLFWSYVAGIMDTEGSFSIKKEKPHSGSISMRYNPVIQLTMVPAAVLNYIRRGCSLGSYCVPKASCTTKGYAFKLSIISKDDCMRFLHRLTKYLRFKKGQLFTMLSFCENFGSVKHCRGGIPQEILDFREEMYQQMRKLNK
jgi:hypothetical protein